MSDVNIRPEALQSLSGYISDIEQRLRANIAESRAHAAQISAHIAEEVARRKRRVEELWRQYETCCRREGADCSELRRQLSRAEESLQVGIRAQTSAAQAIAEFGTKSRSTSDRLGQLAAAGKQTITKLQGHLDDYSAFSGLVPGSVLTSDGSPGAGGVKLLGGAVSGPGVEARKLPVTSQGYHMARVNGAHLRVFDHPIQSAAAAVINQGSAHPEFQGTCGLCAIGTICRKAGVPAGEQSVTTFAVANGLCSTGLEPGRNGGTSGRQLVSILQSYAGISATASIGTTAADLARFVEQGRGVIIGVNPHLLPGAGYGPQTPGENGGHWIVLQSAARDPVSHDVVGFFLHDSNGTTISNTCLYVPSAVLGRAFSNDGSDAIVTDDVIW
jgi:hypothetical protein